MSPFLFVATLTFAANSASAAILVGPPASVRVAAGPSVQVNSLRARVASVELEDCQGGQVELLVDAEVDLVRATLPTAIGVWCRVSLRLDGALSLEAERPEGLLCASLPLERLEFWLPAPLQVAPWAPRPVLDVGFPGFLDDCD